MLKKNSNMNLEYAIIGVMIFLVGSVLGLIVYDPEFVIQPQSDKIDMSTSESVISFQKEVEVKQMTVEKEVEVKQMTVEKVEILVSKKVATTEDEIKIQEELVEASSLPKAPTTVKEKVSMVQVEVTIPERAMYLGCEEARKCYIPSEVLAQSGSTIVWYNDDASAHTVTSGNPVDGPDGIFDSGLFLADATFSYTFDESGEYQYYCIVHPWMTGTIFVS